MSEGEGCAPVPVGSPAAAAAEADPSSPLSSSKKTKYHRYERKLSDREYKMLISHVQQRPCLWNDCDGDFKNLAVTRVLWNEIGAAMDLPGDEVKKKWKNIKDKYRKLLQQQPQQLKAGSPALTPKWKFFQQMEFTKDVVLPGRSAGNHLLAALDEEFVEVVYVDDQEAAAAAEEAQAQEEHQEVVGERPQDKKDRAGRFARGRKAQSAYRKQDDRIDRKLLLLEEQRLNATLSMQRKREEGGDYSFLMSLLPYMQKLYPLEKLELRSRLQAAVLEAFKGHHDSQRRKPVPVQPRPRADSSPVSDGNGPRADGPESMGWWLGATTLRCGGPKGASGPDSLGSPSSPAGAGAETSGISENTTATASGPELKCEVKTE